jgi:hypothetical protein
VCVYNDGGSYSNSFSKTGGVIYGPNTANSLKNTTASGASGSGHAVFYHDYYYRDITLNAGDNISTADTLPGNSGESLNNWTKKQ